MGTGPIWEINSYLHPLLLLLYYSNMNSHSVGFFPANTYKLKSENYLVQHKKKYPKKGLLNSFQLQFIKDNFLSPCQGCVPVPVSLTGFHLASRLLIDASSHHAHASRKEAAVSTRATSNHCQTLTRAANLSNQSKFRLDRESLGGKITAITTPTLSTMSSSLPKLTIASRVGQRPQE